jgi:hypothetical protein
MNTAFEATAIADSPPSARDERAEGQILKELLSPVKGLKKGDLTNSVSKKEKHNMSAVSGLTSLAVDEDDDDAADDDEHIAKEGDEDDEEEEDDENEGVDMSEKDIEKLKTSSTTPNSTTKRRRRGEEDVPMTFPQRVSSLLNFPLLCQLMFAAPCSAPPCPHHNIIEVIHEFKYVSHFCLNSSWIFSPAKKMLISFLGSPMAEAL